MQSPRRDLSIMLWGLVLVVTWGWGEATLHPDSGDMENSSRQLSELYRLWGNIRENTVQAKPVCPRN